MNPVILNYACLYSWAASSLATAGDHLLPDSVRLLAGPAPYQKPAMTARAQRLQKLYAVPASKRRSFCFLPLAGSLAY
jgi:hypothetical protein